MLHSSRVLARIVGGRAIPRHAIPIHLFRPFLLSHPLGSPSGRCYHNLEPNGATENDSPRDTDITFGRNATKRSFGEWDDNLEQLVQYRETHSDCLVPLRHVSEDGLMLGYWVSSQRKEHDGQKFSQTRRWLRPSLQQVTRYRARCYNTPKPWVYSQNNMLEQTTSPDGGTHSLRTSTWYARRRRSRWSRMQLGRRSTLRSPHVPPSTQPRTAMNFPISTNGRGGTCRGEGCAGRRFRP